MYGKDPSIKCDVLVIGGGTAGIAASISAERAGCRVLLLEKYGFLGGIATAGMAGTMCGLYLRDTNHNVEQVCGGFAREWADEISKRSDIKPVHMAEGLYVLPYDPWDFQRTADRLIRRAAGVTMALHSTVISVDIEGCNVREVRALIRNRYVSFRPSCVVDCTGDASVLYVAGAPVDEETGVQAAAVVFSLDTFKRAKDRESRLDVLRDIQRAVRDKQLSTACEAVSLIPSDSLNNLRLKVNLPYDSSNDWNKLTELELRSRDVMEELSFFFKAGLSRLPVEVGVRNGRRARGRETLTEEDILECRKFPDGVACGAWPMEEWGRDIRPRMTYPPEKGYYEIPIGCLIPESLDNVFVAGRCISTSAKAIASARVIGVTLCTGWAAGKAAAFQAMNKPLSVAVKELRDEQVRGRGHGP